MGMYDNIRCDYPLPDEASCVKEWQTHSTPLQFLAEYVISAEGRLLEPLFERTPDEDRPLGWFLKPTGYRDTNYHGDIFFHGGDESIFRGKWDAALWFEYRARFTEGQLTSITRINIDKEEDV